MRVVSFNIQHARVPGGRVDLPLTADTCAGFDADVLGLQEVDRGVRRSGRTDQTAAIAERTGLTAAFGAALRLERGTYGNALLVRGELADVEVLELPGRRGREARAAVLATAVLAEGEVTVAVTHLSTDNALSPRQLLAVVEALWRRPLPRVLLGDFNLGPASVEPVVDASGMSRSVPVPTFPAWAPSQAIDHVLAKGLEVTSTDAVETPVSDHRALVTELSPPRE